MMRIISRTLRLPAAVTVLSYMAAVCALTWLTVDNHLGDQLYGKLLMLLMAFPVSLATLPTDSWLRVTLIGEPAVDITFWDYFLLAWPGVVLAIILTLLLIRQRTRIAGQVLSRLLAGVVILAGLAITFDGWAPRRPYGWPLLVCGLGMVIGLLANRTDVPKNTAAKSEP
ncbi:hypothetical protein [Nonomuraea sp. NEAU-A123]|uniref:hypothetical protein n=1 Tax=Nonomuraea sp. NEAU-A123 TaxID=2839649 RepID=UPI001BE47C52|nr:hypothetical protein [Nonomuraea sp. NEAU-A123]MBT2231656.1 hypothetical protein [Nonomuraea sp. NEAU-A123]